MGHQNINDDKLKNPFNTWLQSQVASFYDEEIQKLVPRYDKFLNNSGNYVQKYNSTYVLYSNKIYF